MLPRQPLNFDVVRYSLHIHILHITTVLSENELSTSTCIYIHVLCTMYMV